jgi:hypothetical protein
MEPMKRILVCSLAAIAVTSQVSASVLFSDDFSYPNGALIGQGGWGITGTSTVNPLQVNNGAVALLPTGQDANAPVGPVTLTGDMSFFIGATINLSAATTGDYFLHWSPSPLSTTTIFIGRVFAQASGSGYRLGYLETSGTGGTTVYGGVDLNFNQNYRVVLAYNVVSGTLNDTASLYVNPTDLLSESGNTPYLTDTWTSISAEATTLGAVNVRQGGATSGATLTVDDLGVTTTFAEAATFTPIPEPSTYALAGLGAAALLIFRRRK